MLHTAQFTVCTDKYTLHITQYTDKYTLHSTHCKLYSTQRNLTVHNAQYALQIAQYTLSTEQ